MAEFPNTAQPDWDWWSRLWPTPGATLRRLGIAEGDAVAEVASGNGYLALPVARITDPAPVYAVDLDAGLLEELDSIAETQGIGNVVTVEGDARDLPDLLSDRVDVVLLANVFHGIDDREGVIVAAREALRPGGAFVVVNWHDRPPEETTVLDEPRGPPGYLRIDPESTRAAVEAVPGVSFVERVELPPYHYALRFDRSA